MPRAPKKTIKTNGDGDGNGNGNGNGFHGSVSSDEVARRAYELYQSRGGGHGADFDDWLEAEKQLMESQPLEALPPPAPERRKRTRAATSKSA